MEFFFNSDASLYDSISYQKIIKRLFYLTNTRPDICYVIQTLS